MKEKVKLFLLSFNSRGLKYGSGVVPLHNIYIYIHT